MSSPDDRLREHLERLARAAADGRSIDPDRDAGSFGDGARELAENLGVVARIAGARPPVDEGADLPPALFPGAKIPVSPTARCA